MSIPIYQVNAPHDIVYMVTAIKDSMKIQGEFFSNDLGYVPPEFKAKITDSLKILEYEN
jgi:hypothetical protein